MQVSKSACVAAAVPRRACKIPPHSFLATLLACVVLPCTTASAQSSYTVIAGLNGSGAARRLMGGVIKASNGALYGTAYESGTLPQCGAIYKVDAAGTPSVVHTFSGTDGCHPGGELVVGADGHIYGTTFQGGPNVDTGIAVSGTGTVFKISMPGEVLSTIHAFAPFDAVNGWYPEGFGPYAGLTLGNDNNLYGTTNAGGTGQCRTVFRITPAGVLTTLHSLQLQEGCAANAGLALSSDGSFYGTASYGGGTGGQGSVFRITPAGAFTKLFGFAQDPSCACYSKGLMPVGEPVDDGSGYLVRNGLCWGTAYWQRVGHGLEIVQDLRRAHRLEGVHRSWIGPGRIHSQPPHSRSAPMEASTERLHYEKPILKARSSICRPLARASSCITSRSQTVAWRTRV